MAGDFVYKRNQIAVVNVEVTNRYIDTSRDGQT